LKKIGKKLFLRKETLLNLRYVTSGNVTTGPDPDRTTAPSSGVVEICYFSDCNPCDTQAMCTQYAN
jgi:hypothetical protein